MGSKKTMTVKKTKKATKKKKVAKKKLAPAHVEETKLPTPDPMVESEANIEEQAEPEDHDVMDTDAKDFYDDIDEDF